MAKRSKRMRNMASQTPGKTPLPLTEAVSLLKKFNTTKFDQSVEVHIRLGIDPKQADQIVRSSITLPHGIGKEVRVAVFAKGDKLDEAVAAGADVYGGPDLAQKVKDGFLDFDACIATPDMMGVVGPLGRILGPRGLMPAPKAGTVTMDVAKVVKEYKAGKVEFRNDSGGNVHAIVGKLSFTEEQLAENIKKFIDYIQVLKPQTAKGQYIKGIAISATMSPGVRVQQQ
ncbi:MAG: 50S ribosomal protein L1 [Planctomycetia bacterium]|nr:50S ribosomal protein L1 [Planctomycetia bacterium]